MRLVKALESGSRRHFSKPAWWIATAVILLALGAPALAHDIWLHAEPFRLEPGDTLIVRQLVGAELDVEMSSEKTVELPILLDMTRRFELITAGASIDLLAELPDPGAQREVKPVLTRRLDAPGFALVVMDHDVLYTGHTDEEFREYLHHEGLSVDEYGPRMGSDGFQDEGYVRTLKALIRVGESAEGAPGLHDRVTGQAFEILLLQNPYELDPGDALEVEARLHGEPPRGLIVKAVHADRAGSVSAQTVRTDARGRARLTLTGPGRWLVRAVHLARCSDRSEVDCADTEWESYWTAYSFEID